ncbi:MAG: hypothetical protein Q8J68_13995 [Methanolobus sp.]|uniref:hypothetical protein n=1 Tax=Methanolobus sp. TaxID=1874737 RepID=UPI002731EE11|nr:hypothetical protein [Methanolobus sp.]MDP2218385.1 hypothetical protein [Methanolobus sp.]
MVTTKNKAQLNSTVSPWIKKRIEEMVQTEDFSSISDVVSQALSEFIGRYDEIRSQKLKNSAPVVDASYFQTSEGKAMIKSVIIEAFTSTDEVNKNALNGSDKKRQNKPTKKEPIVIYTEEYIIDEIP